MKPHRRAAKLSQRFAYRFVDFSHEGVFDDVEGSLVGVAPAVHPGRFEAGFVHGLGDGLAAAVHDQRPHADGLHKGNVGEQLFAQGLIVEHGAAEFYDDNLAGEETDVLHRFNECTGFLNGLFHVSVSGETVSLLPGK